MKSHLAALLAWALAFNACAASEGPAAQACDYWISSKPLQSPAAGADPGKLTLRISLDRCGSVQHVDIIKSSGNVEANDSMVSQIRKWRYSLRELQALDPPLVTQLSIELMSEPEPAIPEISCAHAPLPFTDALPPIIEDPLPIEFQTLADARDSLGRRGRIIKQERGSTTYEISDSNGTAYWRVFNQDSRWRDVLVRGRAVTDSKRDAWLTRTLRAAGTKKCAEFDAVWREHGVLNSSPPRCAEPWRTAEDHS